MKTWVVEEIKKNEGGISFNEIVLEAKGMNVTFYESNPLEPIIEVYKQMTDDPKDFFEDRSLAMFLMEEAIKKAMGK